MEKKFTSPELTGLAQMLANYATTGLLVVAAFIIGMLWTEVRYLKNGAPAAAAQQAAADTALPTEDTGLGVPSQEQLAAMPKVENSDHFRGNKNAKTTLVVYTDYECPFCKRFHDTTNQVLETYKDKVRVIYRHYPLSFHANAQKAAETAECVAKNAGEDAFWKYTDAYFTKTTSTGTSISFDQMIDLAGEAGANKDAVKKCQESGEMAQKVNDSMAGGSKAGVSGTPGTVIVADGGKYDFISGALPFEQIQVTLDQYVK